MTDYNVTVGKELLPELLSGQIDLADLQPEAILAPKCWCIWVILATFRLS